MLTLARIVQAFSFLCLVALATAAAEDSKNGHHHAASVVFLALILFVVLGLATFAASQLAETE